MNDWLKQSAEAYCRLSSYRYAFLLGRKARLYSLEISFPTECYWHLAGLHKTRVEAFKNRKSALSAILSDDFDSSIGEDHPLSTRWRGICDLQELIESNRIVFHYRGHEFAGSRILADYVLSNDATMFFIADGVPVSVFDPTEDQRQKLGLCPKLTTLTITRENIHTGERIELFRSPSYRAGNTAHSTDESQERA